MKKNEGAEGMPSYFNQRMIRYPLYGMMAVSAVLLFFIGLERWWIALHWRLHC